MSSKGESAIDLQNDVESGSRRGGSGLIWKILTVIFAITTVVFAVLYFMDFGSSDKTGTHWLMRCTFSLDSTKIYLGSVSACIKKSERNLLERAQH